MSRSNIVSTFLEYQKRIVKPAKEAILAASPSDNITTTASIVSQQYSPAKRLGHLLAEELKNNPHFYVFSPDETTSNKIDEVFQVEKRAWNLPREEWDLPEDANGRIIEMLSENVLFSTMTGHIMNGEPAMMTSYEAFFPVITSQILQQIKFFKQCNETSWRPKYPAVNLLSTSTCWRQDHNGYTHQSPALISTLLSIPSALSNCLFPIDDVAAEAAYHFMMKTKNVVNLTTFNKIDEPRFINEVHAKKQLENGGASIFRSISDDYPDIVIVGVGDLVSKEAILALKLIKQDIPNLKLRFVNIAALTYRGIGTTKRKLSKQEFDEIFTTSAPIIANFHGYPETLENILENYTSRSRLRVHGYIEEGSTTTPFEMLRRNAASRYDLAIDIARLCGQTQLVDKYLKIMANNYHYAVENGEDIIK
jgi:xylulose-5-phosphate/fructose-6-phosphate phosphoketolase